MAKKLTISKSKREDRPHDCKYGLAVNGTKIPAVKTVQVRAQHEQLAGPQSAATRPIAEWTTKTIRAESPHSAVTAGPHARPEPADDVAGACSKRFDEQAVEGKVPAPRGKLPKSHG
jgi:hypothetical protein